MGHNKNFFIAIAQMSRDTGIPKDYLYDKVKTAIVSGTKGMYDGKEIVTCNIDPDNFILDIYASKPVVETVESPNAELTLEEAKNYDPNAKIGDVIEIPVRLKKVSRIIAQTIKSIIKQGIREGEKQMVAREMEQKHHEVVTVKVTRVNEETGDMRVEFSKNIEATLKREEQLPDDYFMVGDFVKVYVESSGDEAHKTYAKLSRKNAGMVARLFELEVPEIYDGVIEIKSVSREAGSRTKIAVWSNDENVDPVGSCIGPRGTRVANIVDELSGEKIDIVRYSDDPTEYIAGALAPAQVIKVSVDPDNQRTCTAIVPENQLSLAIGNKGQNVRLAAKLTGWKIDIKSENAVG